MTGIYIIKNTINDKVYIGQSVDILQRWYAHRSKGKLTTDKRTLEYNNKIHSAMRNLGLNNFYIEVLEECSIEQLEEREKYWIAFYDSFYNGYNGTRGGSFYDSSSSIGENNGRTKLKIADIEYIRECYNNHIPFREVYQLYKEKISKRGLQKVWGFETWGYIHPEYNNLSNKYYHSHQSKANSSEVARQNKRKLSDNEVREIREYYKNNNGISALKKEKFSQYAYSTIYNIAIRKTYKDII